MKYNRVLCIPDLQAPYHHEEALRFLRWAKGEVKPDLVVCLGDELDQYTLSKYAHSPDADSAGREYSRAIAFWKRLYEVFPAALAVTSNHVDRVFKRADESGIPRAYLKTIPEFMQAPRDWKWQEHWIVDNIRYEHGERAGGITGLRNLVVANMRSTVIGHQHECPGTTFVSNGEKVLFGLNVGCLVDARTPGLAYTTRNKHKPVLGCGAVIEGVPRFIPMEGYR